MVFVQLLFPIWHFNGVGDQSKKFRKTGPDRKKLDQRNARQQPIKFRDSRFRTGKMLKKKVKAFIHAYFELPPIRREKQL